MSIKKTAYGLTALAVLLFVNGIALGQSNSCNSCNNNTGFAAWPTDCSGSNVAGHRGQMAAHREEIAEKGAKIYARNAAWPKPFICNDRQAYFSVWTPMITNGWIAQCTLNDTHFDDSGKLNSSGERKISTIMMNFSGDQRVVYVGNHREQDVVEQRVNNVREVVSRWYGDEMANRVTSTQISAQKGLGSRVEAINAAYAAQQPPPVINAAAAQSSGSATGNSGSGQ